MNLFSANLIFLYKYLKYLPYFIINALDLNIQKTFTYITACKRLVLWSTKDQEGYSGVIQQMRNEMWGSWIPSGLTSLSEARNWKGFTFSSYF